MSRSGERQRASRVVAGLICGTLAATVVWAQDPASPAQRFRAGVDLVVVDAVVRDASGAVVRGLTADDFEVLEDGQPQTIVSFDFEEVSAEATASPVLAAPVLLPGAPVQPAPAAAALPLTRQDVAGRRLVILLFDLSSMQPEDVEEAAQAAIRYVDERMTAADLVAVATIESTLEVLGDFTADPAAVRAILSAFVATDGTAVEEAEATTAATDEAEIQDEAETGGGAATSEYDLFNNDVRLRAIRTLAENLRFIEQKKAIVYFSAGMRRSGGDNQVELRAAVNAAVRANVALYPVDTRGLQAVVPGGSASQRSGRGASLFSGRGMARQFDQLFASQETLSTLADDTGGEAFIDTNDFGEAFAAVQRDLSSYYLIGYRSPDAARDGRYRRITVRVRQPDLRVEHRAGYYAERDFAHTGRQEREFQLQDQLQAPLSATDLPVIASSGWFRQTDERYYVPVVVVVPGAAVPLPTGNDRVSLDILGVVRDEQGRPVGRIADTIRVPRGTEADLAARQVLYQSGLSLPPGRFALKVVVRENTTGQIGSYETSLFVPDLSAAPVKVSSVTLSSQVRPAQGRRRSQNPLVRDGLELIPSLTHVIDRDQRMFFYYEVYQPATDAADRPSLKTSLAFYRNGVKVFETPMVERHDIDDPQRGAALFQFEVPPARFLPGLYTCQVNIVDDVNGTFVFPRLTLYLR